MARAYVLIEMGAGHSRNLVDRLEKTEGFEEVSRVTGPYDVIAVVEGGTLEAISNLVLESVHPLEGVRRTTTCVCME